MTLGCGGSLPPVDEEAADAGGAADCAACAATGGELAALADNVVVPPLGAVTGTGEDGGAAAAMPGERGAGGVATGTWTGKGL